MYIYTRIERYINPLGRYSDKTQEDVELTEEIFKTLETSEARKKLRSIVALEEGLRRQLLEKFNSVNKPATPVSVEVSVKPQPQVQTQTTRTKLDGRRSNEKKKPTKGKSSGKGKKKRK